MDKLDFPIPDSPLVVDSVSLTDLPPARRLIVLVPADSDYSPMTHRIWDLANLSGNRVLLISLCKDPVRAPSIYRQLITMAALIQNGNVMAEAHVETGNNWAAAITNIYQAGDMVVCFVSQRAGLFHKPLSQVLQSSLKIPIYILSDVQMPEKEKSQWVPQFIAWAGSIGLITGFFLLQVRVVMLPSDWIQNTLLLILLVAELWLVWLWNSQFG
jgi:hypothetical protein